MRRFRLVTWLLIGWTIFVAVVTALIALTGDITFTDPIIGFWFAVALWLGVGVPLVVAWFLFRTAVTPARVAGVIVGSIVGVPLAYYLWLLLVSIQALDVPTLG